MGGQIRDKDGEGRAVVKLGLLDAGVDYLTEL